MGKDRRKFEAAFKRQLVQQIEAGGLTRMQAARTHQLSPSLIDRWRKQFLEQKLVDGYKFIILDLVIDCIQLLNAN